MVSEDLKKNFEKQGYRLVGKHSAVKICEWTRKSIADKDTCYKEKFYGIKAHRCCQMSCTLLNCQHACLHCWRDVSNTNLGKVKNPDSPKEIIDGCIGFQRKLLSGCLGNKNVNRIKFFQAQNPKHFAISLIGEGTLYPKLSHLIRELKKRKITSFLVTNGENPDVLQKMDPPTQLYLSLNATNENMFNKLANPIPGGNGKWKNILKTLKIFPKLKTRTVIRITLMKGINDSDDNLKGFAKLIKLAKPMFIEVKAYMFIGSSRKRLKEENMPNHSEVRSFSKKLAKQINYNLLDEKKNSRVVLLGKSNKNRFIKF